MRWLTVTSLVLMAACGGRVEGNPGSVKANTSTTSSNAGPCTRVKGSKYAVCGNISGSLQSFGKVAGGLTQASEHTGTLYAMRGANYAR